MFPIAISADSQSGGVAEARLQIIPVRVAHDGPANVSRFFTTCPFPPLTSLQTRQLADTLPTPTPTPTHDSSSVVYSQFRGRLFCGAKIVLPPSYTGTNNHRHPPTSTRLSHTALHRLGDGNAQQ
jgi:hypothetical protein